MYYKLNTNKYRNCIVANKSGSDKSVYFLVVARLASRRVLANVRNDFQVTK